MAAKEPKKKPRTFISFHHKDGHAKGLPKTLPKEFQDTCIGMF